MPSTNPIVKKYAETVRLAADLKEKSWDNSTHKYTLELEDACEQACKQTGLHVELARPMYLGMETWWNDMLEWTDSILS